MRTLAILAIMMWACTPSAPDEGEQGEAVDLAGQGEACVVRQGGTGYDEGLAAGPSDVVVFLTCPYKSYDAVVEPRCEVSVDGGIIDVTTEGALLFEVSDEVQLGCSPLTVTCAGPDLADGAWTLTYGDASETFEVPTDERPCAMASAW